MKQCSGWDVLLHASTFILNDQEWLSVPSSFEPSFHACVLVQGLASEDLFSRCTKVLRPLMNAAVSDVYASDGNCILEGIFDGSDFFDCLSYLAVLASPVLGSKRCSLVNSVELLSTEQAGLSATVTSHLLTGRDVEASVVDGCIRPVFHLKDSRSHCKLVLIHGIPGTGKSSLADTVLSRLETAYKASDIIMSTNQVVEEYSYKMQARKRDSVRDGMYKMGLSLCGSLGIGPSASIEVVLPRLQKFLQIQRFVILADDADEDGLNELLLHLPRSCKPCAIIVTSQYGDSLISQINQSDRRDDLVAVELRCFKPEVSLKLVESICHSSEYAESRVELHSWLTQVLDQLGQLPLAVRFFAEWLHQELKQSMPEGTVFNFAGLQARWSHEYGKNDDEDVGILNASPIGSRGLRATVRLVLHNLKFFGGFEECKQLLGLLALCPASDVPWSLFDGGANGEAHFLVRGARVEVTGTSLQYVSPVGERCRVHTEEDTSLVETLYARVVDNCVDSDLIMIEDYEGIRSQVHKDDIEFDPHISCIHNVEHGKLELQVVKPHPANFLELKLRNYLKLTKKVTTLPFPTYQKVLPEKVVSKEGRIIQFHAGNGTVSVVFGCESGECRWHDLRIFA
jgi:hypothetical protein